jgi:HAD superfamily hydrolase (TIGR01509 family)
MNADKVFSGNIKLSSSAFIRRDRRPLGFVAGRFVGTQMRCIFRRMRVKHRPMKYQALLFDFDGLILDTETAHYQAWREAYADFGLDLPLERWAGCIGTDWNAFNPYQDLESRVAGPFDREGFRARKEARASALIKDLKPRPGMTELMKTAQASDVRLGIASSSNRAWVTGHLERLGLLSFFSAVRTSDDVQRVKPHPELFLSCLEALGVSKPLAAVLEDSPNGIRAAKAAGIYTLAYPNPVTVRLDLSEADRVARTPEELMELVGA